MFGRRNRRMVAAENAARAAALEAGSAGLSHPDGRSVDTRSADARSVDARSSDAASRGAAQDGAGSAGVEPTTSGIVAPAPAIELTEERVFAAVLERLQDFVGENGSWTLTRRSESDTEVFFHDMAALSLARAVTSTLVDAAAHGDTLERAGRDELAGLYAARATADALSDDDQPTEDAATDASARDRAVSPAVRTIMELDTIAVWADPKSHDPAYIDERLLHPQTARAADADRANGQRRA
jgi:hypothetical protein